MTNAFILLIIDKFLQTYMSSVELVDDFQIKIRLATKVIIYSFIPSICLTVEKILFMQRRNVFYSNFS